MKTENECSTQPISKSEVKKLINEEKDNIIQEVQDSQKIEIKKEIKERFENELLDYEKRVSTKFESSYQENFEAIKFLSDKVKQCLDQSRNIQNYDKEIHTIQCKINEISQTMGNRSRKSFIGTEKSENETVWEKVDCKLDKIYEFQQKIGRSNYNSEENREAYNQFGNEIVGLVKNIVKGNQEDKENEVNDFNHVINYLNSSIKKYRNREEGNSDSKYEDNDRIVTPEVFRRVMDRMTELVMKWNKYEDKGMTRCGTDKDKFIYESGIECSEDKRYTDDISHVWTSRFNELSDEISDIKISTQNEFDVVNQTLEEVQKDLSLWKNSETKINTMTQDNIKSKFEYFAKNINEIYSLIELIKKKLKDKTQSK